MHRKDRDHDREIRKTTREPTDGPATGTGSGGAGALPDRPARPDERARERRFVPEEREDDVELYDAASPDMPPSPAGANVDIGGEAASSRRLAGLPPDLARRPGHRPGTATPGREPFLGYDGFQTDDVLDWIEEADPDEETLRRIVHYERDNRRREPIVRECVDRIRRLTGSDEGT